MAHLILWNTLNIPHAPVRPAACHYLASWLRQHGHAVKVIDFCSLMSTQDLVNITLKNIRSNTVAVGVSSTFWKRGADNYTQPGEPQWVLDARRIVQQKHLNLDWVLGGSNTHTRNLKFAWQLLHGHAEDSLLVYMNEKTTKQYQQSKFDIATAHIQYGADLGLQSTESLPLEMSRGCQFKCTFCGYPLIGKKKGTYLKGFDLTERELLMNYEEYGITKYAVLDDTFNESDEKVQAMADIAQRLPFKLEWAGYNRLDLIGSKKHTIQTLKDAGLRSAFFGIESFHKDASKIVGKGWNGIHGKDFLLELKKQWGRDVNFHLSFIVGLPGETEEDIHISHQWCKDNNMPSWNYNGLQLRRGGQPEEMEWASEFSKNSSQYGFKFPHPLKDSYWENGTWNVQTAEKKANELTNDARAFGLYPTSWRLNELSTLGFSFDELMNKKENEFDYSDLNKRNRAFVQTYVDFQMKWNDN